MLNRCIGNNHLSAGNTIEYEPHVIGTRADRIPLYIALCFSHGVHVNFYLILKLSRF